MYYLEYRGLQKRIYDLCQKYVMEIDHLKMFGRVLNMHLQRLSKFNQVKTRASFASALWVGA